MSESPARYRLLEHLGTGTLGELHRARDLQRGRTVALRLADPRIAQDLVAVDALLSAAQAAARLSHPSVAAVFDSGIENGRVFVVSEFVPGERLSAIVRGGRLHPARALEIAGHVADALSELHALGLTYGTLSTDAIMLTPRGAAKLLDCGLSSWTRAASDPARDDVEALGDVLFEMLAGRPRRAGWPGEFRIPEIPPAVASVLERMSRSSQNGRFESILEAAAALRDVAANLEQRRSEGAAQIHDANRPAAKPSGVLVALAAAVVALAATVWFLLTR